MKILKKILKTYDRAELFRTYDKTKHNIIKKSFRILIIITLIIDGKKKETNLLFSM